MFVSMSKQSEDVCNLDLLFENLSGGEGLLSRRIHDGVENVESKVKRSWAGCMYTFFFNVSETRIGYNCLLLFYRSVRITNFRSFLFQHDVGLPLPVVYLIGMIC